MGRITRFAMLAALLGVLLFMPARAEAHTKACTGVGAFNVTAPMTYTDTATVGFEILMPGLGGVCQPSGPFFTARGILTGRCGEAIGTGYADAGTGHPFTLLWLGNQIIAVGGLDGEMTLIENPFFLPNNCVTGASSWFGPGAFALVHAV